MHGGLLSQIIPDATANLIISKREKQKKIKPRRQSPSRLPQLPRLKCLPKYHQGLVWHPSAAYHEMEWADRLASMPLSPLPRRTTHRALSRLLPLGATPKPAAARAQVPATAIATAIAPGTGSPHWSNSPIPTDSMAGPRKCSAEAGMT